MPSFKQIAVSAGVTLLVGTGCAVWWLWPEVEDIPDELESIDAEVDPLAVTLEAQGDLPAVKLGDLGGKTAFFVIEGRESFMGEGEAKELKKALNRWTFPEDVVGFTVGDAEGFGLMRDKIEKDFLSKFRPEARRPLYVDYTGDMMRVFKLPKGHLGFFVLGPDGEIVMRHSGDADTAKIEEIRQALSATEPDPGPDAPTFSHVDLDNTSCKGKHCVFVFLDDKVALADIPGMEGGFDGDMDESFERIGKPSIRLSAMVAGSWAEELGEYSERIQGAVIGEWENLEVEAWKERPPAPAPELRAAFAIGESDAGMVIVDPEGRVAFKETGLIPFWKLGLASDILGVEGKRGDEEEEED